MSFPHATLHTRIWVFNYSATRVLQGPTVIQSLVVQFGEGIEYCEKHLLAFVLAMYPPGVVMGGITAAQGQYSRQVIL